MLFGTLHMETNIQSGIWPYLTMEEATSPSQRDIAIKSDVYIWSKNGVDVKERFPKESFNLVDDNKLVLRLRLGSAIIQRVLVFHIWHVTDAWKRYRRETP